LVFDEVQADLEAEGYQVTPFLLPACAVNAPHRRDRIWFVAYSSSASQGAKEFRQIRREDAEISGEGSQTIYDATRPNGIEGTTSDSEFKGLQGCADTGEVSSKERTLGGKRSESSIDFTSINKESNATDTNGIGQECRQERKCSEGRSQPNDKFTKRRNKLPGADFQMFPTSSPICNGDDGLSNRLDSITFSKWRNESIKAGGNAIVPQVVYQIFKAIQQYNELDKQLTI
jgi:DNA (cytosine-5)-methyltransferase 1